MTELNVLLDGIYFGEGPRWHDGHLYLSDFYAHEVLKVDPAGNRKSIATVPNQPSGLGWTDRCIAQQLVCAFQTAALSHLTAKRSWWARRVAIA